MELTVSVKIAYIHLTPTEAQDFGCELDQVVTQFDRFTEDKVELFLRDIHRQICDYVQNPGRKKFKLSERQISYLRFALTIKGASSDLIGNLPDSSRQRTTNKSSLDDVMDAI
jgi:hypothetical protein